MAVRTHDLRDLLRRRDAIRKKRRTTRTADDLDFVAEMDKLDRQLPLTLEQWADNSPTLIHEADFVEWCEQYAEDIGSVRDTTTWPCTHVDWVAAADDIRDDFRQVEYDGDTYLIRSF